MEDGGLTPFPTPAHTRILQVFPRFNLLLGSWNYETKESVIGQGTRVRSTVSGWRSCGRWRRGSISPAGSSTPSAGLYPTPRPTADHFSTTSQRLVGIFSRHLNTFERTLSLFFFFFFLKRCSLWRFDTGPDPRIRTAVVVGPAPDLSLSSVVFKMQTKNKYFSHCLAYYLLYSRYIYISLQRWQVITIDIKVFWTFFLLLMKGSGSGCVKVIVDPGSCALVENLEPPYFGTTHFLGSFTGS